MIELAFQSTKIRWQKRGKHLWFCLTDMAKANNKLVGHWSDLKSTQLFLTQLEGKLGFPVLESKVGGNITDSKRGTWAIEEVANEFYRWCTFQKKKDVKKIQGVIYMYKDSGNNALKIGFTTNLKAREKQHKTSNPFLELVKVYENVSFEVESLVHEKLKKYRIQGTTEWYKNRKEVLSIVDLICSSENKDTESLFENNTFVELS